MFADLCVVDPPHQPGKKRHFRSCLIVFPTAAGARTAGYDKVAAQWPNELWVLAAGSMRGEGKRMLDSLSEHLGAQLKAGDCVLVRRVKQANANRQGKYALLRGRASLQSRVESLLTGGADSDWKKAENTGAWSPRPPS